MAIYGNPVGGALNAKTFMLEVNGGKTEIAATVVGEETVFDATPNDVRTGKTFATSSGVAVGTKDIPAYRTAQGAVFIKPNENFSIFAFPPIELGNISTLIVLARIVVNVLLL